jgi:hypothetical protein
LEVEDSQLTLLTQDADRINSIFDEFTRGAEAGGRYGGGGTEGLQELIMNLINPEETDLFEADTP